MGAPAVPMPVADRTAPPYHMYEMIRQIPASFRETLRRLAGPAQEAAAQMADRHSLAFTGCGTAFYAARLAERFASSPSATIRSSAVGAFELAHYSPWMGRSWGVVGISHSGITKTTVDAVREARDRGARTVGVTHHPGRPIEAAADSVLIAGDSPDLSRCHTKCYVAGALAGAMVGLEWRVAAGREPRARIELLQGALAELPPLMERVLQVADGPCEELAVAHLAHGSVGFFGAGPNVPVAVEAALKIREASFLPAQGMEIEDFLHGSWQPLDRDSVAFVIAPEGPAHARALELMRAARIVGARVVALVSEGDRDAEPVADVVLSVPPVDELLSPFLNIIPLYLYAYHASVKRGNNPDFLRYLDPAYWDARSVIFPPGTH